jgi:hypothetical protein
MRPACFHPYLRLILCQNTEENLDGTEEKEGTEEKDSTEENDSTKENDSTEESKKAFGFSGLKSLSLSLSPNASSVFSPISSIDFVPDFNALIIRFGSDKA